MYTLNRLPHNLYSLSTVFSYQQWLPYVITHVMELLPLLFSQLLVAGHLRMSGQVALYLQALQEIHY